MVELGNFLNSGASELEKAAEEAYSRNPWFTKENVFQSLNAIAENYLKEEVIRKWLNSYDVGSGKDRSVGIVMAGNIPLVGFHDLLCTFICGYRTLIKCSSKDEVLIGLIQEKMSSIDARCEDLVTKVELLKDFDYVIATGGNTAAKHFKSYFKDKPNLIRKNRTSVAVLRGDESNDDLINLGSDVFTYFGLGCRSVSKLYLPRDFKLDRLFEAFYDFKDVINHNKYKNNYDYNHAIYLLGKDLFHTNDFIVLREDPSLASRIASLHYEYYNTLPGLSEHLIEIGDDLQCISSKEPINGIPTIPFGQCQNPSIDDYADGMDTMQFLLSID